MAVKERKIWEIFGFWLSLSLIPTASSEASVDALWKIWYMNTEVWSAQRRITENLNCNDCGTREWMLSWSSVFFFPPQLCSSLSQKSGFNVCHQPEWHYESTSFYIVCLSVYISRIFNKGWDTCSRLSFPTDKNCSPACKVWIILFIDYWLNKIKFFRFF